MYAGSTNNNSLSSDEIWAILREVGRKQDETARQLGEFTKCLVKL